MKRTFAYAFKSTNRNNNNEEDTNITNKKRRPNDDDVTHSGRHIYFMCDVSEKSVESLVKVIEDKNKEFEELLKNDIVITANPKPLYLHITSYGGDLFAGFRALDAITRSKIPIYTVIEGCAASAATLMSVVGDKRFITPYSYMLIHQLSSGVIGKHWDIEDEYNNCTTLMEDIYEIYTNNTNLTKDQLRDYLSHDIWWKSEKCIQEGLVDAIYEGEEE